MTLHEAIRKATEDRLADARAKGDQKRIKFLTAKLADIKSVEAR